MRVGVLRRAEEPLSAGIYRENVVAALAEAGVEVLPFAPSEPPPPGAALLWDPALGMGRVPRVLRRSPLPVVVTVHGLRAFSLPLREAGDGPLERARLAQARLRRRLEWRDFGRRVAAVVGVSEFGVQEVIRAFGLPRTRLRAIHHGVAHAVFRPEGETVRRDRPYLLHVSSHQRKKNVARLLRAHARLPEAGRPELVLVVPGWPGAPPRHPDVTLLREPLAPAALAPWYRGALAFAFPSLHETFGMPILEAMACGAPVLTSRVTACPEVAGGAALLVDPRSEDALTAGLRRLCDEPPLRAALRERGLARAADFDWRRCGDRHRELFAEVAAGAAP